MQAWVQIAQASSWERERARERGVLLLFSDLDFFIVTDVFFLFQIEIGR